MIRSMSTERLAYENCRFQGTGGVSAGNRDAGFRPAFLDTETLTVYLSSFADGQPAPFHLLDGLPDEVVLARNGDGGVARVKASVISGFVWAGRFFTRDEAAATVSAIH